MDFVPREEFEAVKDMAAKARAENEGLAAKLEALETRLAKAEQLGEGGTQGMPSKL